MHPFSTPWKHQETVRFSDVSGGRERKGALGTNGLNGLMAHTGLKSVNGLPCTENEVCYLGFP